MSGSIPSIYQIIANAESSGGVNVWGPVTSSGQAQGAYQITTGTWNQYAPQAGVSLSDYPTPNSAPVNIQTQVASVIPLQQWAPSTVSAVQAAYPYIDTSQTVGTLASTTSGSENISIVPTGSAGVADTEGYGSSGLYEVLDSSGQEVGLTNDPTGQYLQPGQTVGPALAGQSNATGEVTGTGTGTNESIGLQSSLVSDIGGWLQDALGVFTTGWAGLLGSLENWVVRFFLVLLGVVVIGIALWAVVDPDVSLKDVAALAA